MDTFSNINRCTLFLGIAAFLIAAFAAALLFGIGAGMEEIYRENKFFPIGFNPYRDLALRCIFIAILFLFSTAVVKLSRNLALRIIALALSILTAHQSVMFIRSFPTELPHGVTEYSRSLELVLYTGHFLLALVIILLMLQISMIWLLQTVERSIVLGEMKNTK